MSASKQVPTTGRGKADRRYQQRQQQAVVQQQAIKALVEKATRICACE